MIHAILHYTAAAVFTLAAITAVVLVGVVPAAQAVTDPLAPPGTAVASLALGVILAALLVTVPWLIITTRRPGPR